MSLEQDRIALKGLGALEMAWCPMGTTWFALGPGTLTLGGQGREKLSFYQGSINPVMWLIPSNWVSLTLIPTVLIKERHIN